MLKPHLFPSIVFVLFQLNIQQFQENPAHCSELDTYFFGQLNGLAFILFGIVIYIRYRQIEQLIEQHPNLSESSSKTNKNSMHLGYCLNLGIAIALNLQYMKMPILDYFCSLNCFGFSIGYFWMQNQLTECIQPYSGSKNVTQSRFVMTVLSIIFTVIFAVGKSMHFILAAGNDSEWWILNDFWLNVSNQSEVISSMAEWFAAINSGTYIMTFKKEFKSISFERPAITIIRKKRIKHQSTESV